MIAPDLKRRIEASLSRSRGGSSRGGSSRGGSSRGGSPRVVDAQGVSGGCIHQARRLQLDDGSAVFLKSSDGAGDAFQREAEGLEALGRAGELRVPEVLAVDPGVEGPAFLLLEHVESGRPSQGFFRDFGRRLARLHRTATAERYGFESDNFLGATPQPNPWTDHWTTFWAEHRLGHQLRLARERGLSDPDLERLGDRLLDRLPELLDPGADPPSLLHGDLWSGNFMVDSRGEPVLVDPAAYYGRREAELAMTRLFGGFGPDFYRAYEEEWPLEPGSEERLALYELYHLLNHLNLFGRGYRSQCMGILSRLT